MPYDVLTLATDATESRLIRDPIGALYPAVIPGYESISRGLNAALTLLEGNSTGWSNFGSDIWTDPVNFVTMLSPLPTTSQWNEGPADGFYSRLRTTDFTFTGPASDKWQNMSWLFDGDNYLINLRDTPSTFPLEPLSKATTNNFNWPENQPWYFEIWLGADDSDTYEACRIWLGSGDRQAKLILFSDGTLQVWRKIAGSSPASYSWQGEGNIAATDAVKKDGTTQRRVSQKNSNGPRDTITDTTKAEKERKKGSKNLKNKCVTLLLIPYKRRELLIVSNQGGNFCHVFKDVDPEDNGLYGAPEIIPAGIMSFAVPHGRTCVQASPVYYKQFGWAGTIPEIMMWPPDTGEVPGELGLFYDVPGYPCNISATARWVDQLDPALDFVANGVKRAGQFRFDLTGDIFGTPFLYGGYVRYDPKYADLPDASFSLDDYSVEATLDVPESAGPATMQVTLKGVQTLEDTAYLAREINNRSFQAKIGTLAFFSGRSYKPRWTDDVSDDTQRLLWEIEDRWAPYSRILLRDCLPYDGRQMVDVIRELAILPGYSEDDLDIEDLDFMLPPALKASQGNLLAEWSVRPEEGDTIEKWLKKFHEEYTGKLYIMGWCPTSTGPKFRFRDPESYNKDVDGNWIVNARLYNTRAAAEAVGIATAEVWKNVYRSYQQDAFAPEANVVTVTGVDAGNNKPIRSRIYDALSIDPTVPVDERPDNWMGDMITYGLFDASLRSKEITNWVASLIFKRLSRQKYVAEWESELIFKTEDAVQVPVWKGDIVGLDGHGLFRVVSMSGSFDVENTGRVIRPFRYTGEWVSAFE